MWQQHWVLKNFLFGALLSCQPNNECKSAKKKECKNSEIAKCKWKKQEFVLFPSFHTESPVPDSKATRQEKEGSWVRFTAQMYTVKERGKGEGATAVFVNLKGQWHKTFWYKFFASNLSFAFTGPKWRQLWTKNFYNLTVTTASKLKIKNPTCMEHKQIRILYNQKKIGENSIYFWLLQSYIFEYE